MHVLVYVIGVRSMGQGGAFAPPPCVPQLINIHDYSNIITTARGDNRSFAHVFIRFRENG